MFTPSRLALARKRRGLTLVSLAEQIGMTAQSLSNAECGRQDPSDSTLEMIAKVLGFPVSFFHEPDLEEIQSDQVTFRARTKMTARVRDSVLSAAALAVAFRKWIETRFRLPAVDVPTLGRRMRPEVAAEHVRARWGIGDVESISNMIHLLEAHGVAVFSLPPEHSDVDAFSFWREGRPYVVLNTMKSAERSRFDAAHELGHLVMHGEIGCDDNSRVIEREANAFASAFLMSRVSIHQSFDQSPTTDEIIRAKRRWKVAALALTYRLHDLGIISDWSYRRTVIELGRLGYNTGEPDGIDREASQLLAKVFSALRDSGTSFLKISKILHVTQADLNDLVFGLALASVGEGIVVRFPSPGEVNRHSGLRGVR